MTNTGEVSITPRTPNVRARWLAFWTSVFVLASLVLLVVGYALWTSTKGREDSVAASHTASAKSVCDAQYAQLEQEDFERTVSDFGGLIVKIATITPGDDRTTAVAQILTGIQAHTSQAIASLNARAAYLNAGRPLPCPFPATVTASG